MHIDAYNIHTINGYIVIIFPGPGFRCKLAAYVHMYVCTLDREVGRRAQPHGGGPCLAN